LRHLLSKLLSTNQIIEDATTTSQKRIPRA
jgi:hypothetical protein